MITVGVDTYITTAEADNIIKNLYINQPQAARWQQFSIEDKESYLRNATYRIDCLKLNSYKHDLKQVLQFPRGLQKDIPYQVKLAQCEEALAATDTELLQRLSLQQQGVQSVKLGNASESYTEIKPTFTDTLLSVKAYNYLRPYLLGSAVIV